MDTEKYRAELAKIKVKYAANPTFENIRKMQREMTELFTKLTSGGIPDGANLEPFSFASVADAYARALEEDGGGGEYNEEETARFIQDHPVPKDKAEYLPIGALLLLMNGEPFETFAVMGEKDGWRETLKENWGMRNAADGKKMLASLLEGRHEAKFGNDYRNFKAGKPHGLDEESVKAYEKTIDAVLPLLLPYLENCRSLAAWDLECAGYLARIFAHLEWLSAGEAFRWLEKTAAKIRVNFSNWEEYAASILAGRAVATGVDYRIISAAAWLFEADRGFLKSCSLPGSSG